MSLVTQIGPEGNLFELSLANASRGQRRFLAGAVAE